MYTSNCLYMNVNYTHTQIYISGTPKEVGDMGYRDIIITIIGR